jgi:hypothetical protein
LKIRRKIALNNSRVGFYVTLGSSDEDLGESVLGESGKVWPGKEIQ